LAGEAIARRILRYAHGQGVRQAVLNLHHLPETITGLVGDGSDLGIDVRYSFESPVLGSAGGPRKALPLLPDEDFFLINGDTLANVDFSALEAQHRETGALATIAVVPNRWPDKYSGLILDSKGRFHSVAPRGSTVRSYHVIGIQIVHPSAFARLPLNEPSESIAGVYRVLVAENLGAVRAFLCQSDFVDVGTPLDYLEASSAIGQREALPLPHFGTDCDIDPTARISDSILWDRVRVGPRAVLHRCIVADDVEIQAGAVHKDCVIIQREGTPELLDLPHV
jgi:NDP-sugar pyrophosphorylase family protein